MVLESYERVPSILSTVTSSFSTAAEKTSVQNFHTELKNSDQLFNLENSFQAIYTAIDKNIKWRSDNEEKIITWIKNNTVEASTTVITTTESSTLKIGSSILLYAVLMLLLK